MADTERAKLAMEAINETCGGDGHTLFDVYPAQETLDRLGIDVTLKGRIITESFARDLRRQGGWGRVGAHVISGEGIVGRLASWAGVDLTPADRYMGRGTRHRAAIACIADAARED